MRVISANLRQEVQASLPTKNCGDQAAYAAALLQEALSLLCNYGAFESERALGSPDRLVRLPEVMRLTGLGRSSIYKQMKEGGFPRSVKVGPRASTWSEAAIQEWIRQRLG